MNKNGHFVISLDFELFWGVRDTRTFESYGKNILGVRQAIPSMLDAFYEYNVSVTFATVGFLFCQNRSDLTNNRPDILPAYSDKRFSPYENGYISSIGEDEKNDPYHFGHSLIKLIQSYPQHEVASHTFSHYYCLEGSSIESFRSDLDAALKMATTHGITLKSIVFPRNQYSIEHLKICKEAGLESYRGNEKAFVYQPRSYDNQNILIKVLRLSDAYINLFGHHCVQIKKEITDVPINIPASRFLRPYSSRLSSLENLKLHRIKKSMTFAAKKNLVFHLWWHPHNFGINLNENIKNLMGLLKHYKKLQQQYGFQSITMKDLAAKINNNEH